MWLGIDILRYVNIFSSSPICVPKALICVDYSALCFAYTHYNVLDLNLESYKLIFFVANTHDV